MRLTVLMLVLKLQGWQNSTVVQIQTAMVFLILRMHAQQLLVLLNLTDVQIQTETV